MKHVSRNMKHLKQIVKHEPLDCTMMSIVLLITDRKMDTHGT